MVPCALTGHLLGLLLFWFVPMFTAWASERDRRPVVVEQVVAARCGCS